MSDKILDTNVVVPPHVTRDPPVPKNYLWHIDENRKASRDLQEGNGM